MATISAETLSRNIDTCRANNKKAADYLTCVNARENDFLTGAGNTMTPDGKGGKVFTDTTGGKVFVDAKGGKVFSPPPGTPAGAPVG